MGIAVTLENYLKTKSVAYDVVEHRYSEGSFNTAVAARVPCQQLLKGVVFRDEDLHYTMAILPASHRVRRHTLNQIFDRRMELADEEELEDLFHDCEKGAIPCLGQAYGMNVIWDDDIEQSPEFFLEAGDHQHLIHMAKPDLDKLIASSMHDKIAICTRHDQPL
ncbi:YbaK/EbsC family protein [Maricurvus nonylphenolicus]|uniref:aminoacyl-tRNA deacylase n=1 Tax=Maricurvus nonylphenolicus TaxID=1008307 RepID=UPI0036F306D4